MARDLDKYYYVEVALPKGNPAIEAMVAQSESQTIALRVLIKQAVINAYTEDDNVESPKVVKSKRKANPTAKISDKQTSTADSFLDEGF